MLPDIQSHKYAYGNKAILWQSQTLFSDVEHKPWDTYAPSLQKKIEWAYQHNPSTKLELTIKDDIVVILDFEKLTQARKGYPNRVRKIRRFETHGLQW